jgi:hypothetical protein
MSQCFEREFETAGDIKAPFSRQLVVDFYDGTLTALVECGVCRSTYSCFMIDSDKKLAKRIFALRPIDPDALTKLTALGVKAGATPTWPYWVPHVPEEVGRTLFPESTEILNSAGPAEWVIAATPYLDTIFAAKRVPNELASEVVASMEHKGTFDWLKLFGLPREAS